ncbi:MAG TPA: T9SS type A sorting domain-containing protein [Candidatus Kapabacteria bacterium]
MSCSSIVGLLDSAYFTGSSHFHIINSQPLPRPILFPDSLLVQYNPLDSGTDSAVLHLRYDLGSGPKDTTIAVVGTNHNAPPKLTLSTLSQTIVDAICNGKDTSVGVGIIGCGGAGGILDSLWMSGSSTIGIASSRRFPQTLGPNDSVLLRYNPDPSGNDTSYLHIRYDAGTGLKDTMIRVIGILDSSLRTASLVMASSPSVVEAACTPITIPLPLDLEGCISVGQLDSVWLTGSRAVTIQDVRHLPRVLDPYDSIELQYLPGATAPDTTILHLRYNIGDGTKDTTLTVIGRIQNPIPPRVLTLPASPQSILTTTCGAQDSTIPIGITGCPLGSGTIDSVWLTGSNTIAVNDSRSTPRTLEESDSLRLEYNPNGAEADTSELHIQYDLGSGPIDTAIQVIGTVASPLVSAPASLHRESASAYYGGIDSLTLQLDLATSANLDSLWNTVTDISGTVAFDPSVVSIVNYLPPKPWTEISFTVHASWFDFEIRNKTGKGQQPFDLGTALFRPRSTAVGASWITLSQLLLTIGKENYALCVTENEDNHWAVKTLGEPVDAVADEPVSKDITIYPNPAMDEIMIGNPNGSEVAIEMYDAIGRKLLSTKVASNDVITIDISRFSEGTYFVRSHVGQNTILYKVNKLP